MIFVDGRTAAVLAYGHGKHHINLFVWPAGDGADAPVREDVRRSFTLPHWTKDGLHFWAASDVSADDLREFVRPVRGE